MPFTSDLALQTPEEFAESILRPLGTKVIAAGENFRFGRGRSGDLDTLAELGFDVRPVPLVEGVSSSRIRQLLGAGEVEGAAQLLGRAPEVEGTVVAGDARGGTLGYPTANLAVPSELLVPAYGIYAGQAGDHRAAISIGVNPHYGGQERRVEAFLLDFEGDLYGRRLVVELWQRLRGEQAFGSEQELIDQIGRDVAAARAAEPPVQTEQVASRRRCGADRRRRRTRVTRLTPPKKWCRAGQVRTVNPERSRRSGTRSGKPGSRWTSSPTGWRRGRSTAASGLRPSSRTPARTWTRALRSRVPPAAPTASASPRSSRPIVGDIMLAIRSPGESSPTTRSASPSMLFRWRSRPGTQSPEPRPRLVVRTTAFPSSSTTHRLVVSPC